MPSEVIAPTAGSRRVSAGMLALALAVALVVEGLVVVRSPVVSRDGPTFIGIARQMQSAWVQGVVSAEQHPGYPTLILAARPVAALLGVTAEPDAWILPARLVAVLGGALSVLALWLLARSLFDARVAGVCALIFSATPLFRQNAADTLSDAPHLLFYLLAVWAAVEAVKRRSPLAFAGAGLAGGLAYWVRPEGLVPVVAIAAALLFWLLFPVHLERRRALLGLLFLLLTAALVAGPYVAIKGRLTDKKNFLLLLHKRTWERRPAATPAAPADAPVRAASAEVDAPAPPVARESRRFEGPPDVLPIVGWAVWEISSEVVHAYYYGLIGFLLLGLLSLRREGILKRTSVLVAAVIAVHLVVLLCLCLLARYIDVRHTLPAVACGMPWVGLGAVRLGEWFGARLAAWRNWPAARTSAATLAVLVAVLVAAQVPRAVRPLHDLRLPIVAAARQLAPLARPGDRVFSNSPYVPFYANLPGPVLTGRAWVRQPVDPVENGCRFIVLDLGYDAPDAAWLAAQKVRYTDITAAFDLPPGRPVLVLERRLP